MKDNTAKTEKILAVISVCVLIALTIPLFIVSHFGFPAADEYSDTYSMLQVINNGGGFFDILINAFKETHRLYMVWQGRYFDVFTLFMDPFTIRPELYFIVTYVTLPIFLFVNMFITVKLITITLKTSDNIAIIVSAVYNAILLLFMLSMSEAFFWYSSAIAYTLAHSAMQLFFYLIYLMWTGKKVTSNFVWAMILAFVLGGLNYGTATMTFAALALLLIQLNIFIKKDSKAYPVCGKAKINITAAFYTVCLMVSVLAPGNRARKADHDMGIVKSIVEAYLESARLLKQWTHIPIVLGYAFILAILVPFALKLVRSGKRVKLPGLYTFLTFSVYASTLALSYYGTAGHGPGRLMNLQDFLMYPLVISNIIYWVMYVAGKLAKASEAADDKPVVSSKYLIGSLSAFCVLFAASLVLWGITGTTVTSTVVSLIRGEAQVYKQENLEWIELLSDPTVDDVYLPIHEKVPYVLMESYIDENPEHWINYDYARYFGKNTVTGYHRE